MSAFDFPTVTLRCTATVGGERLEVQQMVDAAAYDTVPELREHYERCLRYALIEAILEKHKPKIEVLR